MYFRDIIGQEEVKSHLRQMIDAGQLPHALLFDGQGGAGELPLAMAAARYLMCTDRHDGDACGQCPACQQFNRFSHPDVHFAYPIYRKSGKKSLCSDFLPLWRQMLSADPYFSFNDWMGKVDNANAQGTIYAEEGNEIIRQLGLKSYESPYKVMIVWLPEKMNPTAANRLLKIVEEPPENTFFFLVSENSLQIIGTILSRTQRLKIRGIDEVSLQVELRRRYPQLSPSEAASFARLSEGNWLKAVQDVESNEDKRFFLDQFVRCMRGAYTIANFGPNRRVEKQNSLIDLKAWSEEMAKIGRERQKLFFGYSQRLIRENFIMNARQPQLNYLTQEELAFSSRFFPFINQNNVEAFLDEFQLAEQHIEQNVNARMVFFDLALKAILLFKK